MKPPKINFLKKGTNLAYSTAHGDFTCEKEYRRYLELLEMQEKGLINGLRKHASFTLLDAAYIYKRERQVLKFRTKIRKKKVCVEAAVTMEVSFVYYTGKGKIRVEVAKDGNACKDSTYIIKRKLMRYLHQITVVEN